MQIPYAPRPAHFLRNASTPPQLRQRSSIFSTSSTIFNGYVCHPNTNFEIYVTTSLFDSSTSNYEIISFPEPIPPVPQDPRYYETFVSGHPYYQIRFVGLIDPASTSHVVVKLDLSFVNDFVSNFPSVYIEVFDKSDNLIHSDTLGPTFSTPYGAAFSITTTFPTPTQASYVNITTSDKYGLIDLEFTGY